MNLRCPYKIYHCFRPVSITRRNCLPLSYHNLLQKAERRAVRLTDKRFEKEIFTLSLDPDSDITESSRPQKTDFEPFILPQLFSSDEQPPFVEALAVKAPYPPAKADMPNKKYSELIRGSFCGKESEMTAVMSGFYHGMKFSKNCPELSNALIGIAFCELRHFILLGKMLMSLGGDPKFFCCLTTNSNAGGWWSANPATISYCETVDKALKGGIAAEKATIAEYKSISDYIDDKGVKAVLKRIIADELLHLETLECLCSRFCE